MVLERGAQRVIITSYFAVLGLIYVIAWLSPALGMYHDDGVYLLTARALASGHALPQTKFPPLWPAVLALFTLISSQPQWLKIASLLSTAGWLLLTRRLLLRMGATANGALLIVALTAASPTILFFATNLMAEPLFGLLATACLLMLLDDRAVAAGVLAGLATLTLSAGAALIAACILTLAVRRRFSSGLIFTAIAVLLTAPWFGWSLAAGNHFSTNILTSLAANEKLVVLFRNSISIVSAPYDLLSGFDNTFAIVATFLVFAWSLIMRRQLVPDLFAAFFCLMVLGRAEPPHRLLGAILPLLLWIVWRVFQNMERREALYAAILVAVLLPLWADATRIPATRAAGFFEASGQVSNNWSEMQKLFAAIRSDTPPDAVLLANLDPVFSFYTGRKTVRGFSPNGYALYYAQTPTLVTPDQLLTAIRQADVSYVIETPDRDYAEAPLFHRTVDALERGGILEPVSTPGLPADYRLLSVVRTSF
jgi:hypothetical protein